MTEALLAAVLLAIVSATAVRSHDVVVAGRTHALPRGVAATLMLVLFAWGTGGTAQAGSVSW